MKKNSLLMGSAVLAVSLIVGGCGSSSSGGGGGGSTTLTGYLLDSGVKGVTYTGDKGSSGITGAGGSFQYVAGEVLTYTIGDGNLTLGKTAGLPTVTPLQLANATSLSNNGVLNRIRLMIALDSDGDPTNGIDINETIRTMAQAWNTPDFTAGTGSAVSDFGTDTNGSAIIDSLTTAGVLPSGIASLPAATTAQSHFTETLQCAYSGGYVGSFTASDGTSGSWGVLITPDGTVNGGSWSTTGPGSGSWVEFSSGSLSLGSSLLTLNGTIYSDTGSEGTITASASVNTTDHMSGNFSGDASGSFEANRVGGSSTAAYRFSGYYDDEYGYTGGLFTMDVDTGGTATGMIHDLEENREYSFSGTASGGTLSLTVNNGATVSGSINLGAGTISANWYQDGASGSITGAGCTLRPDLSN